MRLLYLQQLLVLPGCAGNNRCWQFAKQWLAAGHHITLLASDAQLPSGHPLKVKQGGYVHTEWEGIELYLLSVPYDHMMPTRQRIQAFGQFFYQAHRLVQRLNRGAYDAVLAYSTPLSVGELGRQVAARWRKPFFFEVADVWPEVPIEMGAIRVRSVQRWLHARTDAMYAAAQQVFPYSEGMTKLILARGVSAARVQTIPNGADLSAIAYVPRLPTAHSPVSMLYTGTIGRANDLGQLMRVMHALAQQGRDDIHLTVVGQGNDARRVQALAHQLALRQVTFVPMVSRQEATDWLAHADLGVVCFAPYPVLETNAATKFFDYLAAGLPILINYEGWQGSYLRAYGCGLSAPQGDEQALAKQIARLADDPVSRVAFGQAGRRLAETRFDRRMLAAQMLQGMLTS
jgi:glycosyltransferase involved in cell wall biosynthesis